MGGYLVIDVKYSETCWRGEELKRGFPWYLVFYVSNRLDGGIQNLCVDKFSYTTSV